MILSRDVQDRYRGGNQKGHNCTCFRISLSSHHLLLLWSGAGNGVAKNQRMREIQMCCQLFLPCRPDTPFSQCQSFIYPCSNAGNNSFVLARSFLADPVHCDRNCAQIKHICSSPCFLYSFQTFSTRLHTKWTGVRSASAAQTCTSLQDLFS